MWFPTFKTHISKDPTLETHIPSDTCSPKWETHIPSDMCYPTCIPKDLTNALGPKLAIFSTVFLFGNRSQENVFFYTLEQNSAFLGYKNRKLKKSKYWRFCKRVNPWFWSKNGHFSDFFLAQENLLYNILRQKNAFPGYKNAYLQ